MPEEVMRTTAMSLGFGFEASGDKLELSPS